jgi:hypothetical protein
LAIIKLLKVAAGVTLFCLVLGIYYLMRDEKKKDRPKMWKEAQHVG